MEIKVDPSRLVIIPIDEIQVDPNNRNKHPEDQIVRLMELIKFYGFRQPLVISTGSKMLRAGHGRLEAAKRLGMKEVPVLLQDFEGETEEKGFSVADNAIAGWAELDYAGISLDLSQMGPDFNVDMLGIRNFALDVAEKGGEGDGDSIYTKKLDTPIYEPKGEKPKESELYDCSKAVELVEDIESTPDLPDDVRKFLLAAAARHTVFDFEKIAEYYAHAPAPIQELMQRSALVIIDFKKAIEYGFVKMTKEIAQVYPNEE